MSAAAIETETATVFYTPDIGSPPLPTEIVLPDDVAISLPDDMEKFAMYSTSKETEMIPGDVTGQKKIVAQAMPLDAEGHTPMIIYF